MIVRNRYRLGRVGLSILAILIGAFAGFLVGRQSILGETISRLEEYSGQLLQHDEEISAEVVSTLEQANASANPPCSEADVAILRRLTFSARFLKDVGRVGGHSILCSATLGKLPAPELLSHPDFTFPTGSQLFRNYPIHPALNDRAEVIARQNAVVVISPDTFAEFPQSPIQYFAGSFDQTRGIIHSRDLGPFAVPAGMLSAAKVVRFQDTLYRGQCSRKFAVCVVTRISVAAMWQSNRRLLRVYVATGTIAGIACAAALLLGAPKGRSQTSQLKRAIMLGKLAVAYQPIVELGSHHIVGVEALARWTDEDGESIRPETIIALAEAEGFVSEITRFVVTRALAELGPIFEVDDNFRVNINLAPSDLADPRLLLLLDEKLHETSVSAAHITFELTERATSERDVAVAAIRRLRKRGHQVFIDDFGTGYSNLAYLNELNVNGIKINRSFIATIGTDSVTASIVPQILAVAKALGLSVVVQGIERAEQASYFAEENPEMLGQGWYFGLPISARTLIYLCAEKSE